MLNLERIGNITAELSASLVRSIVLPGGLFGRRPLRGEKPRTELAPTAAARAPVADGSFPAAGTLLLADRSPLLDDGVVACIRQAGGRNIRVTILTAGPADAAAFAAAARPFRRYGIAEVEWASVTTRAEAEAAATARLLEGAHVIVLCGDDAAAARQVLLDTAAHGALVRALFAGRVVVGTGAAGAILADRFLVPGPEGEPVLHAGLGLLPRVVLPAGFDLRQSHCRLMHAVGAQAGAQYLGVALEGNACLVVRGGEARVTGAGAVTFMDGKEASCVPEETMTGPGAVPAAPDGPAVCGLKVHVLVAGYGLNLRTRRPMGPPRDQHLQAAGAQG